jgi:hypothetical protein
MNLKQSTTFLIWCGHKQRDGCTLTDQEFQKFCDAHDISVKKCGMLLIKESDHEYTRGQPFD